MIEVRENTRDSLHLYDTERKSVVATFYRWGSIVGPNTKQRHELPMRDNAALCELALNGTVETLVSVLPGDDAEDVSDEGDLDALRNILARKGVPVDKRWNRATLKKKIDDAETDA